MKVAQVADASKNFTHVDLILSARRTIPYPNCVKSTESDHPELPDEIKSPEPHDIYQDTKYPSWDSSQQEITNVLYLPAKSFRLTYKIPNQTERHRYQTQRHPFQTVKHSLSYWRISIAPEKIQVPPSTHSLLSEKLFRCYRSISFPIKKIKYQAQEFSFPIENQFQLTFMWVLTTISIRN